MMKAKFIKKPIPTAKDTVVVGIDPSLTGMGLALFRNGLLIDHLGVTTIKKLQRSNENLVWYKTKFNTEIEKQVRTNKLAAWVVDKILVDGALFLPCNTYVAIEGYAFSRHSRGLSDIHELCGVIKYLLCRAGIEFRIYDPLSVKLAWTGSGKAEKEDMILAAETMFGLDLRPYGTAAENIADAALIGALLNAELRVKAGKLRIDRLSGNLRKVLLRTTKQHPVALVSRELIAAEHSEHTQLIGDRLWGI